MSDRFGTIPSSSTLDSSPVPDASIESLDAGVGCAKQLTTECERLHDLSEVLTMSKQPKEGRYNSIQAGRGIAAVLVMLFHLGGTISAPKYFNIDGFAMPFKFGSSGVEYFFVLSGFLLVSIHRHDAGRRGRVYSYAAKRIVRVFPSYWLFFVIVYVTASIVPSFQANLPANASSMIKSLLLLPQNPAIVGGTGAPVIAVAWTLQYEVLFYICLGLFIANRRMAVTIALVAISWAALAAATSDAPGFPLDFMRWQYFFLFGLGACLASMSRFEIGTPTCWSLLAVGAGAFLVLGIFEDLSVSFDRPAVNTLIYGVSSAFIILALCTLERGGKIDVPNSLAALGDASYALYLLHVPLISVLCKLSIWAGFFGLGGALLCYLGIAITTIVFAIAYNRAMEQPFLAWIRLQQF